MGVGDSGGKENNLSVFILLFFWKCDGSLKHFSHTHQRV